MSKKLQKIFLLGHENLVRYKPIIYQPIIVDMPGCMKP